MKITPGKNKLGFPWQPSDEGLALLQGPWVQPLVGELRPASGTVQPKEKTGKLNFHGTIQLRDSV